MKIDSYLNVFLLLIFSILSVLFTTVFFKFFPELGFFRPNLILIIVIYLGIYRNIFEGACLAFFISYIDTIHSPSFVGGVIFINIVIFFVLNYLSQTLYVRNIKAILILVTSDVAAEKFLYIFLLYTFKDASSMVWFVTKRALAEIPADIVFTILIFRILRRVDIYTGVKKKKADFFSGPVYLRRA